jgi:ketosteroid isomerase-like protein
MAQPRSPREVFLALVNGIAEGNPDGLPELYAEQTNVVHPFDPLRGAPLRSRDELRKRMESLAARPRPRRRVGNVTIHETTDPEVIVAEFASPPSARRRPPRPGPTRPPDRQRPGHGLLLG